jgi:hypothetical protein
MSGGQMREMCDSINVVKQQLQQIASGQMTLHSIVDQQMGGSSNNATGQQDATNFRFWDHEDGAIRRVPPGWTFPQCNTIVAYKLWHCGDMVKHIAPIKKFVMSDIMHLRRGR